VEPVQEYVFPHVPSGLDVKPGPGVADGVETGVELVELGGGGV
jgi:hypothetical protein